MGPRFDHPADGPSVSALKHGRARRRVDGWLLAPVAVAGVVLGHSIGYVAAQPNARARAGLLRLTGHVYWNAAVAMALVAAVWALASHAVAEFRTHGRTAPATESLWHAGARLALLQVGAFTVMEAAERSTVHAPVSSMFVHHLFFVGVAVQVAVAAMLVQVLRFVGRVAVAVARKLTATRAAHRRTRPSSARTAL